MDPLTLFGFLSVTTMLVAYTLEERGRIWILIFSLACLSSALYGLLAGTWPFAVVETVWAGVAFRGWWRARRELPSPRIPKRLRFRRRRPNDDSKHTIKGGE